VAQEDLFIYDFRLKKAVAEVEKAGIGLVNCNSSFANPVCLIAGYENGKASMIDMRMMSVMNWLELGHPLVHFEVHQHLPFCVGSNGNHSLSLEYLIK
jgi:hypothetical protein